MWVRMEMPKNSPLCPELQHLEPEPAELVELEIRLMSGQLLAEVQHLRSEGLSKLRERIKEVCEVDGPFWLLHQDRLVTGDLAALDTEEKAEKVTLVLVKRSLSDLSAELVGFDGAAYRGDLPKLCALLDDGASIEHRDSAKLRTPLMWAACGGHADLCRHLLHRGADPLLRASGTTAAQLAQGNGHEELAVMLNREVEEHDSVSSGSSCVMRLKKTFVWVESELMPVSQLLELLVFFAVILLLLLGHSVALLGASLILAHTVPKVFQARVPRKLFPWTKRKSKSVVAPLPDPIDE